MSQTVQVTNLQMKAVADTNVATWLASNPAPNDTIPYGHLVNVAISIQKYQPLRLN